MKVTPTQSLPLDMKTPQGTPDTRPGFKETLQGSINQVNQRQLQAHTAIEELATGRSSNLHETMIAIQKAEVSFKMLMQVRNKIINAYQEVMRMSV
jgi:flagellar hook-basal body complex protein FliE